MRRRTENLRGRPRPPTGVNSHHFQALPSGEAEQAWLGLLGTGVGDPLSHRPPGPRLLLPAGQPDLCRGGLPAGAGAEPAGRGRQPAHGPAAGDDGVLPAEEQVRTGWGLGAGSWGQGAGRGRMAVALARPAATRREDKQRPNHLSSASSLMNSGGVTPGGDGNGTPGWPVTPTTPGWEAHSRRRSTRRSPTGLGGAGHPSVQVAAQDPGPQGHPCGFG